MMGAGHDRQRVMQGFQLAGRRQPEFLLQSRRKGLIGGACARGLTGPRQRRHQHAQCAFIERILIEQARCELDRAGWLDVASQVLLCAGAPCCLQAFAFEAQPARPAVIRRIVKAGKQVSTAQSQRIGDSALRDGGLECADVGFCAEPQCATLRLEPVGPARRLQAEQRLAQVGEGVLRRLVGP